MIETLTNMKTCQLFILSCNSKLSRPYYMQSSGIG